MNDESTPKSGSELISSFFETLSKSEDAEMDKDVVATVVKLYKEGKLSNKNLLNELTALRGGKSEDGQEEN